MNMVRIVVDNNKLRELVVNYLEGKINVDIPEGKVQIETKSKQNYKAEWENAEIRASIEVFI